MAIPNFSSGYPESNPADYREFESTIAALRAEIANVGAHGIIDGSARAAYDRQTASFAADLMQRARRGQINWKQAATEAKDVRNIVMEAIRGRSTPVGRAVALAIKPSGRTLNELVARKTLQLFGEGADFNRLTQVQKNKVYADIVRSSGTPRGTISRRMRTVSRAGRGLIVMSLGISVWIIATSDDPAAATRRELAVTGSGIAGGIAAGALAGLACGPGAPACVTLGAFAGGALAAFGVDMMF